jgi:hypothetical protein
MGTGVVTQGEGVAIGYNALTDVTCGCKNIAIGQNAAGNLTTGCLNVAMGCNALGACTLTGSNNVAIGRNTYEKMTTGNCNIAMGLEAGCSLTTGNYNVLMGVCAGNTMTTSSYNMAYGFNAFRGATITGNMNIGIGYGTFAQLTSGTCNMAIMESAMGAMTNGTKNIGIGHSAGSSVTTQSYVINIGNAANQTGTSTGCISANMYFAGHQNSDCRAKRCIADSDLGLDFINALRPVKYKYKIPRAWGRDRDGNLQTDSADFEGTSKSTQFQYGFLAQELEAVIYDDLGLTYNDFAGMIDQEIEEGKTAGTKAEALADPDNVWFPGEHCYDPDHPDYQTASATTGGGGYQKTKAIRDDQFTAPVVKAIQELDDKVVALTARVTALE